MISTHDIAHARRRIAPHVRKTPLLDVRVPHVDARVTLKLECLQHTGSFKARGAFNSLIGNARAAEAGVAAASGGNHGAAVAYAAKALGLDAHVFVPTISSPAKVARIRSYGAQVVQDGDNYAGALQLCNEHISATGAASVHAYNATSTLAGQGTLAAELETQLPDADTLLVAVGGGGLIGGIAAWYAGRATIVGIEPETCSTLHAALSAGKPCPVPVSGLAADSLGASQIGDLAFEIARAHVATSLLVTDDDIRQAQGWLWENCRVMAEPGGAAAFAALLTGTYQPGPDEKICAIICGANVDPMTFVSTP